MSTKQGRPSKPKTVNYTSNHSEPEKLTAKLLQSVYEQGFKDGLKSADEQLQLLLGKDDTDDVAWSDIDDRLTSVWSVAPGEAS
jgi:hypothetical protein